MKIIFIRHGEPNYRELEERSYTGFGIDLAPLSEKGKQQAQELCKNPLFGSADILVSSAVTRALETAFYVSCATGLPLKVEPLLHEWQVYETGIENFETARCLFLENKGELLPNSPVQYETAVEMKSAFSRIKATSSLGISPNSAHASSAKISTSSQARYLFSSLQMFAISGRE